MDSPLSPSLSPGYERHSSGSLGLYLPVATRKGDRGRTSSHMGGLRVLTPKDRNCYFKKGEQVQAGQKPQRQPLQGRDGEHRLPRSPCSSSSQEQPGCQGDIHVGIEIPRHQLQAEPAPAAVVPAAQLWPSATFGAGGPAGVPMETTQSRWKAQFPPLLTSRGPETGKSGLLWQPHWWRGRPVRRMWEGWFSKQIFLGNPLLFLPQKSSGWRWGPSGHKEPRSAGRQPQPCGVGKPLGFSGPLLNVL